MAKNNTNVFLFYLSEGTETNSPTLPDGYIPHWYTPTWKSLRPRGGGYYPFLVWTLFHFLRVFHNHHYRVLEIYHKHNSIHRSCVFPPFFRFPFMRKDDLQVGDTWTHPTHRGNGLASFSLSYIVNELSSKSDRIWYLVEQDNIPSIRVAEKAGFLRVAKGTKLPRWGSMLLGQYVADNTTCSKNTC